MLRFVNRVDALPFMPVPAAQPRDVVYAQGMRALAESCNFDEVGRYFVDAANHTVHVRNCTFRAGSMDLSTREEILARMNGNVALEAP